MEQSNNKKWYDNKGLVIFFCIFFFPVGLYAIWKSNEIKKGWKIGYSIFIGIIFLSALIPNDNKEFQDISEKDNQDSIENQKYEPINPQKDSIESFIRLFSGATHKNNIELRDKVLNISFKPDNSYWLTGNAIPKASVEYSSKLYSKFDLKDLSLDFKSEGGRNISFNMTRNEAMKEYPSIRSYLLNKDVYKKEVSDGLKYNDYEIDRFSNAYIDNLPKTGMDALSIDKWSWESGGFGSVGIANITFKNESETQRFKDIKVLIEFKGESGTVLSTREKIITTIIKPNSKKSVSDINFGFIDNQSEKASITIKDAYYEIIN